MSRTQLLDVDLPFGAVREREGRALRRGLEERAHLPLRPVERILLHGPCGREQREQDHRLPPCPDENRSDGDREHEEVDVDPALAQVLPGIHRRVEAPRRESRGVDRLREPGKARDKPSHQRARDARRRAARGEESQCAPAALLPVRGTVRLPLFGRAIGPFDLLPEPELLGGFAGFAAHDGRASQVAQLVARRGAPLAGCGQPGLHRGDRLGEPLLKIGLGLPPDRRDRELVRTGIDTDRVDAGLLPYEADKRLYPVALVAGGGLHAVKKMPRSAAAANSLPGGPTGRRHATGGLPRRRAPAAAANPTERSSYDPPQ